MPIKITSLKVTATANDSNKGLIAGRKYKLIHDTGFNAFRVNVPGIVWWVTADEFVADDAKKMQDEISLHAACS